ncbi:hypothetical protein [Actinokineospora iranica]|uniref:Uncharacterized protein n=1 Tax=Actinokineospora iranica TaxID=1271860 RepID=A0A1G6RHL2_9PSEU|nr:hypothetical protein [Actinokineospora iranica]SDD03931.1 hypothetical protein SAMN05216174_106348 [Actinokineospora iranica]
MGNKKQRRVPVAALPAEVLTRRVPRKLHGVVPGPDDPTVANRKPAWGLSLIDDDNSLPWGGWPEDRGGLIKIMAFLQEMEKLTWAEIWAQLTGGNSRRGPKHKSIPVEHLIKSAQDRLTTLDLDDHPELFRFRLGSLERLWGVFVGGHHIFYPLWWDAAHQICPSRER